MNYFIDATVLSGHAQPYRSMVATRGLSGIRRQNGELLISHIQESYVWRKAGIVLGYLSDDDPAFEHLSRFITQNRSDYPEFDTDTWDAEADDIRRMIEQRIARTTG